MRKLGEYMGIPIFEALLPNGTVELRGPTYDLTHLYDPSARSPGVPMFIRLKPEPKMPRDDDTVYNPPVCVCGCSLFLHRVERHNIHLAGDTLEPIRSRVPMVCERCMGACPGYQPVIVAPDPFVPPPNVVKYPLRGREL